VEEENYFFAEPTVEQLARTQLLVDGKAKAKAAILETVLIDQWIVLKEAKPLAVFSGKI